MTILSFWTLFALWWVSGFLYWAIEQIRLGGFPPFGHEEWLEGFRDSFFGPILPLLHAFECFIDFFLNYLNSKK